MWTNAFRYRKLYQNDSCVRHMGHHVYVKVKAVVKPNSLKQNIPAAREHCMPESTILQPLCAVYQLKLWCRKFQSPRQAADFSEQEERAERGKALSSNSYNLQRTSVARRSGVLPLIASDAGIADSDRMRLKRRRAHAHDLDPPIQRYHHRSCFTYY